MDTIGTTSHQRRVVIDGARTDRRAFEVRPREGRHEVCPACKEPETDLRSIELGGRSYKVCAGCEAKIHTKLREHRADRARVRVEESEVRDAIRNSERRTRPHYEP